MENSTPTLNQGERLKERYEVVRRIGYGTFGSVYEGKDLLRNGAGCAIKLESLKAKCMALKYETYVLSKMQGQKHILKLFDYGKQSAVRYLVMQLAGKSLSQLRKEAPGQCFGLGTSCQLTIQCIEALRDMHAAGFLHRDVKPGNFAIGNDEADRHTVYIFDFGLAKCYREKSGALKQQRQHCSFRGTLRYASPNVHQEKDQGRQDDLWSILYMLIEFRDGTLPWKSLEDKDNIGNLKLTIPPEHLLKNFPEELQQLYHQLKELTSEKDPQYEAYIEILRTIMRNNNIPLDQPFDWESNE
ncbi:putative serine/threonine-protein kinase [Trichinella papuae]|uniref:Putative serine/threonine-protein kinase n=1 Tax=Trichinella papuae TaxID=268474 RepID=A0A0V1N9W7_9BILA|nr:putative serine/threonine-protein kinase [Trichinella papuae]